MLTTRPREIPDNSIAGTKILDGTTVDYVGSLITNSLTVPKTGVGAGSINGASFSIGASSPILSASAYQFNARGSVGSYFTLNPTTNIFDIRMNIGMSGSNSLPYFKLHDQSAVNKINLSLY